MNREALEALDQESLIRLVLAQAEMIAALTRQVEVPTAANAGLTARVAELEAKLGLPPKTPDNSSLPPSKGQKSSARPRPSRKPSRTRVRIGLCIPIRRRGASCAPSAAKAAGPTFRRRRSSPARAMITSRSRR